MGLIETVWKSEHFLRSHNLSSTLQVLLNFLQRNSPSLCPSAANPPVFSGSRLWAVNFAMEIRSPSAAWSIKFCLPTLWSWPGLRILYSTESFRATMVVLSRTVMVMKHLKLDSFLKQRPTIICWPKQGNYRLTQMPECQGIIFTKFHSLQSQLTSSTEQWKKGPWFLPGYRGWNTPHVSGDYNKPWSKHLY